MNVKFRELDSGRLMFTTAGNFCGDAKEGESLSDIQSALEHMRRGELVSTDSHSLIGWMEREGFF